MFGLLCYCMEERESGIIDCRIECSRRVARDKRQLEVVGFAMGFMHMGHAFFRAIHVLRQEV